MQEGLELQLGREEEARRRIAEVQSDKRFMAGVREALASFLQEEEPTRSEDLKRKSGVRP